MITQERLKQLLDYDPDTGEFTWKLDRSGTVLAGSVAGTVKSSGYIDIRVDGKLYKAHRLAWLYFYGYLPEYFIDHINNNRRDNKIINLRSASKLQNSHNRLTNNSSKSKIKGLSCWRSGNNFYWSARVRIGDNRLQKIFAYNEEGKKDGIAWLEATRRLHHGDFARNS